SGPTADVGLLSAMRWYALHRWNSGQFIDREHYRIVGGVVQLLERIVADAGCDVRLESPVAAVAVDGEHVTVATRPGESIVARSVVLAVPLAVLGGIELPADV